MKSVFSIIKSLNEKEVKDFKRLFLAWKKDGENRKRELFEAILQSKKMVDLKKFVREQRYSRQNYYQLCKRLRENLYDFLFSFHETKKDDERLAEEMDCHKKLYCVKIMMDRNMQEHAREVLDETINISYQQELPAIYFEAVNLKHKYFPFEGSEHLPNNMTTRGCVKEISDNYNNNDYIRQYLVESVLSNHQCDSDLRVNMMTFVQQQLSGADNDIISRFHNVNSLFYERKFDSTYLHLRALVDQLYDNSHQPDICMQGLVCLDLTKVCIALKKYDEAEKYLRHAENHLHHLKYWLTIIYELRYIINLRSGSCAEQNILIDELYKLTMPCSKDHSTAKWRLYSAWNSYYQQDFKEVIKLANIKVLPNQNGHKEYFILKILELICIYQLHDMDWFYYKSESFRKLLNGRSDVADRTQLLFGFIRKYFFNEETHELLEKIAKLENISPWHPLSHELLNITDVLASLVSSKHWHLASCH